MTENVKSFLTQKFNEGAVTKQTDPMRCVADMKVACFADGKKYFNHLIGDLQSRSPISFHGWQPSRKGRDPNTLRKRKEMILNTFRKSIMMNSGKRFSVRLTFRIHRNCLRGDVKEKLLDI